LAPTDDTRGCAGSAILSYGFWQSEYGGRADVLVKTISIDRHSIEIVGVTEPGFNGTDVGASADVMVPLCAVTIIGSGYPRMLDTSGLAASRRTSFLGRLFSGASSVTPGAANRASGGMNPEKPPRVAQI
jgi:hypothetical protein